MAKYFQIPFAMNGDKKEIPTDKQEDGSISFDEGYGADYEKNKQVDPTAKDISRQEFNSVLHDITDAVGEIQRSGVATWTNEISYNKGATIIHNGAVYTSTINANKNEPPHASWSSLDLSSYRKLDDLLFNGMMQVQATDDVGTGVFLLDKEGNPRGQMVANSYGLQFAQVQDDGSSQTFTFPRYGNGGELLLDSSKNTTTLQELGFRQGKANADSNSALIENIKNATLYVSKGDWWLATNTSIDSSVSFISPDKEVLKFKEHVRTRAGGSSGSINVNEKYTQFVLMNDYSTLKFYINNEEKEFKWVSFNTIETQGSLSTDTVKFVISNCSVPADMFNTSSSITNQSPNIDTTKALNNLAYGTYTLSNIETGINNVGLGAKALVSSKKDINNTAIGFQSLYRLNDGSENTAVGSITGEWMVSGSYNTLYGCGAGGKWKGPLGSVAIGWHAGWDLSNPKFSVAVGYRAHASTGYVNNENNVAVGAFSMDYVSGNGNVAVGYRALNCQYAGSEHKATATDGNTSIGSFSLRYLQEGYNNVAVGTYAGGTVTNASHTIMIGGSTCYNSGVPITHSVHIGNRSARNGGGSDNVSIGRDTMMDFKGDTSTVIGSGAMIEVKQGALNTVLGREACKLYTDGTPIDKLVNSTCIGANSRVSGDNQVQLGDANTSTYVYGTVQNRSDARDKKDIVDLSLGLDFVMQLKPKQFKWDYREWEGKNTGKRDHVGFIAQELQEALKDTNYAFVQDHSVNGGADVLSVGYDEFIGVLTKAIHEQQKQIEELQDIIAKLK